MVEPPVPGHGQGARPGSGAGLPGGRDGRLAAFAEDGTRDTCPPGAALGVLLAELSGPGCRCDGATDDELIGLLGRWAAMESWVAASKLGVLRELIRRRARPGTEGHRHGDLPNAWDEGVGHEVTASLGMSLPAADKMLGVAWELGARLPGIAARLADGTIDYLKAKIVAEELFVLDDEHAARAEAMIIDDLAGKTPGLIGKLAAGAVASVDPDGTRKRREQAERDEARVRFWREHGGACALAAYGLPTDAALSANANVNQRAQEYKKAKVSPGATMDQLRVLGFLDILNGIGAAARIAQAQAEAQAGQAGAPQPGQDDAERGRGKPAGHDGRPDGGGPGNGHADDGGRNDGGADDGGPNDGGADDDGRNDGHADDGGRNDGGADDGGRDDRAADDASGHGDPGAGGHGSGSGDGPDSGRPDGGSGGRGDGAPAGGPPAGTGATGPALPARINLTIPFATLLDLAERPGESHGLGPLDPALARDLAAAAARSPHSEWCVTVTNAAGMAIGHGCARPARTHQAKHRPPGSRDGPWAFTSSDGTGTPTPPDGFGSWTITLPGGRDLAVDLGPVPLTDCDHRYESRGYQPGDTLRHLVQVRDGKCTFPCCSRHARESDFEHAIPYEKGGRTCACNAGARSRRCHRVKQSKGWKVEQPLPGWHVWTTPSGRTYTQGPMKYPA